MDDFSLYQRQMALRQIGAEGQKKISKSKIVIVGAGGLGCPAAVNLALAGVGKITLVDGDTVSISNLHRQFAYTINDNGKIKVDVLSKFLKDRSYHLDVKPIPHFLSSENISELQIDGETIVLDCTDDIRTKYLLSDYCYKKKHKLIYASINRFLAHLSIFDRRFTLRHVFPDPPSFEITDSCAVSGVLGAFVNTIGSMQATLALHTILKTDVYKRLDGRFILFDDLQGTYNSLKIKKRKIVSPRPSRAVDRPRLVQREVNLKEAVRDYRLIDVRSPFEYQGQHIPGSKNIPLGSLFKISSGKKTPIFICAAGVRSKKAKIIFKKLFPDHECWACEYGVSEALDRNSLLIS